MVSNPYLRKGERSQHPIYPYVPQYFSPRDSSPRTPSCTYFSPIYFSPRGSSLRNSYCTDFSPRNSSCTYFSPIYFSPRDSSPRNPSCRYFLLQYGCRYEDSSPYDVTLLDLCTTKSLVPTPPFFCQVAV